MLSGLIASIFSWFSSDPKRIRFLGYGLIALAIAGFLGYVGYLHHRVGALSDELAATRQNLAQASANYTRLVTAMAGEEARRSALDSDFRQFRQETLQGMAVFDEKAGRFEKLLARKPSLIVKKANLATAKALSEAEKELNK